MERQSPDCWRSRCSPLLLRASRLLPTASAVGDPDGYFIELNQLLGTAAGTEQR